MTHHPDLSEFTPEAAAAWVVDVLGVEKPPVNVRTAAEALGYGVSPLEELDDGVSGVFVSKGSGGAIGFNRGHARVRQRFTIAHELGHALMHRGRMPLFIDKGYGVAFRDARSSTGEVRMEREANAFAAALLMPEPMVREAAAELSWAHGLDLGGGGGALKALAQRFKVSQEAMSYRLAKLGVFLEP